MKRVLTIAAFGVMFAWQGFAQKDKPAMAPLPVAVTQASKVFILTLAQSETSLPLKINTVTVNLTAVCY